jgi:hypothetical protein
LRRISDASASRTTALSGASSARRVASRDARGARAAGSTALGIVETFAGSTPPATRAACTAGEIAAARATSGP